MSYRDAKSFDNLFSKTNRNDRYKQMTRQQQLIEEKKRQIQEKIEQQKRKDTDEALMNAKNIVNDALSKRKPLVFSNDGSFLDQFKKLSGLPVSQIDNSDNSSLSESNSTDAKKNYENSKENNEKASEEVVPKQGGESPVQIPPPLPPDPMIISSPSNYPQPPQQQQFQQPLPNFLPYGLPPPPPPAPVPPPLIPPSVPPPLPPQSIPPPRPMNVQNIPPPPLNIPPPPLPPCFPIQSAPTIQPPQFQPTHPGRPLPHLLLQLPSFNHPQVPPENVQQGNAQGCLPAVPACTDIYSPMQQQTPDQHAPNNNHWYPPRLQSNANNIPPLMKDENFPEKKPEIKQEFSNSDQRSQRSDRKRKSRWSDDKEVNIKPPLELVSTVPKIQVTGMSGHMLTKVTRTEPGLLQYALNAYGSTSLTEEDWKKAEENYKVHLLYQDMMSKRAALEKLRDAGKNKYEYDSDEEIDEKGTWEHKLRDKEMVATQAWAESLTEMAKGKHHIGDFLPPDELKKFMSKYQAVKGGKEPDLSDYKEYKLGEENKGFQMLQKLGWSEGQGLGSDGGGRLDPINKGQMREFNEGLGHTRPEDIATGDDEYDAYRKRMMLAYRFRPNPLNNPRRPYY